MSRKTEILKLREVLIRRRDALRKALTGDFSELMDLRGEPGGDEIDAVLDSEYTEISSQLAELESRELAQIEKALERMRHGTYGVCEITGKPIPLARLRALPYATLCVEAQRELEERGETYVPGEANWGRIYEGGDEPTLDASMISEDVELG